jgi:hypothetical protein
VVDLDLTTARAAAETLMVDTCRITRDAQGADDDTLDQTTGALTPPNPDTITVYSGMCLVHPSTNLPHPADIREGAVAIVATRMEAALPFSAAVARHGDVLIVTSSAWNPDLVGRSFRVKEALAVSFNIRRSVLLEERT